MNASLLVAGSRGCRRRLNDVQRIAFDSRAIGYGGVLRRDHELWLKHLQVCGLSQRASSRCWWRPQAWVCVDQVLAGLGLFQAACLDESPELVEVRSQDVYSSNVGRPLTDVAPGRGSGGRVLYRTCRCWRSTTSGSVGALLR